MPSNSLFFPEIHRRARYRTKTDGGHFADYGEYKKEIREDCLGRCVYCDCHENEAGGSECMELDHFRPYSLPEHAHLESDPTNLVLACRGCNRLKSNNWPARGTMNSVVGDEGFMDPFEGSRKEYFSVTAEGEITPLRPPAKYMIGLLVLNRSTRKRLRELRSLKMVWVSEFEAAAARLEHELLPAPNLTNDQRNLVQEHINLLNDRATEIRNQFLDFDLH